MPTRTTTGYGSWTPGPVGFGEQLADVDVVPAEARSRGHSWPSHVARIDDRWWVINMRSNMADGGVYLFDAEWRFRHRVDLPDGADPIAIAGFRDEVLISDWNNDRVHRVSRDGRRLGDFVSPQLEALVDESIALRWRYEALAWFGIIALVLVVLGLVIKALLTPSMDQPIAEPASPPLVSSDEPLILEPDAAVAAKVRLATWLGAALIVLPVPVLVYVAVVAGAGVVLPSLLPPIIVIGIILGALLRVNNALVATAVTLRGKEITLRDHKGHEATYPLREAIYNDTAIAAGNTAVFFGQKKMAVYDRAVLERDLFPRLGDARKVGPWEMQKALFRMRHPQSQTLLFVLVACLIGGAWLFLIRGIL